MQMVQRQGICFNKESAQMNTDCHKLCFTKFQHTLVISDLNLFCYANIPIFQKLEYSKTEKASSTFPKQKNAHSQNWGLHTSQGISHLKNSLYHKHLGCHFQGMKFYMAAIVESARKRFHTQPFTPILQPTFYCAHVRKSLSLAWHLQSLFILGLKYTQRSPPSFSHNSRYILHSNIAEHSYHSI